MKKKFLEIFLCESKIMQSNNYSKYRIKTRVYHTITYYRLYKHKKLRLPKLYIYHVSREL